MSEPDLNNAQHRSDSKTAYLSPAIGTMATVTGVACNVSGITPAQRAARDAA